MSSSAFVREFRGGAYKLCKYKWNAFVVDVGSILIASYVCISKLSGFSASEYFSEQFSDEAAFIAGTTCFVYVVFGYVTIFKIIEGYFKVFPMEVGVHIDSSSIGYSALVVKRASYERLRELLVDKKSRFDKAVLMANLVKDCTVFSGQLHEHILEFFKSHKVDKSDVYVSVYFAASSTTLEHLVHAPQNHVKSYSRIIDYSKSEYSSYECVKCIKGIQNKRFVFKFNEDKYAKSVAGSDRCKNIQHYFGTKFLAPCGTLLGFLNIEFNKKLFLNEDDMRKFIEKDGLPFLELIENSFLQKILLERMKQK